MTSSLLNPEDGPARNVDKLLAITDALMRRVEQATDEQGAGYAHFQRAILLEEEVRQRTRDLEKTLELLNESNARLSEAMGSERRARADLSNALEAVEEGFALFGPDERLVMFNSRFCGALPDVWDRLHVGMTFDAYIEAVSRSEGLDSGRAGGAAGWADRRRRLHEREHAIFTVPLRSGAWLQVSEHRTPDGGAAVLQTDVTDMIRIERAERAKLLEDQAQMVRATLNHINQGVAIFDSGARLVGWNRRLGELLTPPMRLVHIGAPFNALCDHIERGAAFDPGFSGRDVRAWVDAPSPRAPLSFDLRLGQDLILAVFTAETPDRGFLMSFTDATAERRAVNALSRANEDLERAVQERTLELEAAVNEAERANETKSRFVAAASHDLLQPLSAAKLFISALEASPLDPRAAKAASRAANALDSVESILGALLDISRLDSGKAELKREPTPLGPLLARLKDEFAPAARAKGLDLRILPTDAVVNTDPTYMRRIIQNLLANAVRYTQEGGVLVGVRRRGGAVRVEVRDTGPGIPESRRTDIFREFHRLEGGGDAAQGLGLGLTIVERACALLGHRLALRSEVGRGSCFSVEAPLASCAPEREALREPAMAAPGGLLVLVVEDNVELSAALALQLESWGASVFEARSGSEALALLAETGVSPDALLVDYSLSGGERGVETIAAIRAEHGDAPAAIITASPSPEVRAECSRNGLKLIAKPIGQRSLADFLTRAR
ncbi:MAG: PAS-domain containing protein [Pikeienuella sp.]|uniref:hybrid sensor histidine kinase/response regulator n=1 Tax=Pikeienuella sp. TaxID=2831957 RepID=UPI00391C7ECD